MVEATRWCCSMWTVIESIVAAMSRCAATDGRDTTSSRIVAALMCGIAVEATRFRRDPNVYFGTVQVVHEVPGDDLIAAGSQAHAAGSQKPSAFCFPHESMSAERP